MDFIVWEQDDHQKSRNNEDNHLRRYKRPRILVNLLQTEYEVNRSKTKVVGSIQMKSSEKPGVGSAYHEHVTGMLNTSNFTYSIQTQI